MITNKMTSVSNALCAAGALGPQPVLLLPCKLTGTMVLPTSRALGPCLLTSGLNDDWWVLLMTKIADVWSWHLQPLAAAISSSQDVPQSGHCSGEEPRDIPVIGLSYMNLCSPGSVFFRLLRPLAFLFGLASGGHRRKRTPSSRASFHWSALGSCLAAPHPSTAPACSFNSISAKWVFWGWVTFPRKFTLPSSFLLSLSFGVIVVMVSRFSAWTQTMLGNIEAPCKVWTHSSRAALTLLPRGGPPLAECEMFFESFFIWTKFKEIFFTPEVKHLRCFWLLVSVNLTLEWGASSTLCSESKQLSHLNQAFLCWPNVYVSSMLCALTVLTTPGPIWRVHRGEDRMLVWFKPRNPQKRAY